MQPLFFLDSATVWMEGNVEYWGKFLSNKALGELPYYDVENILPFVVAVMAYCYTLPATSLSIKAAQAHEA